jgi:hypothetical protein
LLELDMLAQAEFLGNDFRWAAQEALLWLEPESIEEDPDRAPE